MRIVSQPTIGRRCLVSGFGVLVVLGLLVLASASPAAASNAWDKWHWKHLDFEHEAVIQVIRKNLGYNYGLAAVLDDWNEAKGIELVFSTECSAVPTKRCIWVQDRVYEDGEICPGAWAGCAQPLEVTASGHFVRVKVNFNTRRVAGASDALRRSIACHEFGHAVGLAHTDRGSSCMLTYGSVLSGDGHDNNHLSNRHAHTHDAIGIQSRPVPTVTPVSHSSIDIRATAGKAWLIRLWY